MTFLGKIFGNATAVVSHLRLLRAEFTVFPFSLSSLLQHDLRSESQMFYLASSRSLGDSKVRIRLLTMPRLSNPGGRLFSGLTRKHSQKAQP